MLVKKNQINGKNSIYKCDRCNVELLNEQRRTLFVQNGNEYMRKKWDLCPLCYRSLEKGISKGYERSN